VITAHILNVVVDHNGIIGDIVGKRSQFSWASSSYQNVTPEIRSQFNVLTDIFDSVESTFLGLKLLSKSPRRKIPNNQLNVGFIAEHLCSADY